MVVQQHMQNQVQKRPPMGEAVEVAHLDDDPVIVEKEVMQPEPV